MATLNTVTSSTRPSSPAAGEAYFETDTNKIIVWDGSAWTELVSDTAPSFQNQYSVDLDGTNDLITFDGTSSTGLTSFSVSFWLYLRSTADGIILGSIGSGISRGWMFYLFGNTTIKWYGQDGTPYKSTGTIPQTLNQWMHIVGVNDNGNASIYLDGSLNSSDTGFGTNFSSSYNNGEMGRNLDGFIDEVAIFNTALSASDISSIYNSGTPDDLTSYSPVGWWRMGDNDGGTGTTITDQGSGSNNATLVNGPTFSTSVPS